MTKTDIYEKNKKRLWSHEPHCYWFRNWWVLGISSPNKMVTSYQIDKPLKSKFLKLRSKGVGCGLLLIPSSFNKIWAMHCAYEMTSKETLIKNIQSSHHIISELGGCFTRKWQVKKLFCNAYFPLNKQHENGLCNKMFKVKKWY